MSEYTVVVAVANPDNVSRLMGLGCLLANEYDGRVIAVTVVEMNCDAPQPSESCHDRMSGAYQVLDEAEEVAAECGAEFDGRLAVGRQVHEVLAEVAEAEHARLIIVGYSERAHPRDGAEFDRLIDEIAEHAPCNLLIARFRDDAPFDRVLVPVRDRLNLDVRREFVTALRDRYGAEVQVVHFASGEDEAAAMHEELESWLIERGVNDWVCLSVRVHDDPAQAIVDASSQYSAVVLGTAPLHEVRRRYFGAVPEYVAKHAHCTTFLLRTQDVM